MSEQNVNSGAGSSKNILDFINFPRGAIGKRGLPATRNARLPSIRNPRDLTLGGMGLGVAPKRTFVPNIPARREKSEVSTPSSDRGKPKIASSNRDRRKESDRGRGRGRNRPEYIQTGGIFSEGIAEGTRKSSSSRYASESSDTPRVRKPVAPVIKKDITNQTDEKNLLQNLLRDDFVDDSDDDEKDAMYPVFLPLNEGAGYKLKIKNEPQKLKEEIPFKKEKAEVKTEEMFPCPEVPEFKPKLEDNSCMGHPELKPKVESKSEPVEAHDLFMSENITEDKQLLFFQFPDVLGAPPPAEDNGKSQTKSPQDASSSQDMPPNSEGLRLADFPEGYIGKLQVLKSGKTRLVLGSLVLDVKMGAPFNTVQDLVSVRTGVNSGDMTVLGHVHHKLICMPDVENLMSQCNL